MGNCPACNAEHRTWVHDIVQQLRLTRELRRAASLRLSITVDGEDHVVIDAEIVTKQEKRSDSCRISPLVLEEDPFQIVACAIARVMTAI